MNRLLLTTPIILLLLTQASADPNTAKILDMSNLKIGDVGKLQPATKVGDVESYYEVLAIHGTHAMTVRERLNKTLNGVPTTQTGLEFGVQGIPTKGLEKGQKAELNAYVFEVIAEMALNPKQKFLKTKILKVKLEE